MNENEVIAALQTLEGQNNALKLQNSQLMGSHNSMFGSMTEDNLIRWQLDLREDLDRIYHLLHGHMIREDSHGNINYVEPGHTDLKPFNEFGVQLLMNIMHFYLNRNTILSNYDEATINWKVLDACERINNLIFLRFEEMGMDTEEKRKMYPMIVQELTDTIHSAYLRALDAGERESLRTARNVSQYEPLNSGSSQMGMQSLQPKRSFSLLNPKTWR